MEQAMQIALGREILSAMQARRTAMADGIYENPVSDYISPEQAARERQRLFHGHPLVMALSGELPAPGDFITNDWSGKPILLVRGDDGKVGAFLNVCRHRGTKVAQGCGRGQRTFVCPYHAWTYGRDGRLLGITENGRFGPLDRETHGLRRLPVAERDGLIWVLADPEGSIDVDGLLGGLAPEIAAYGLDRYAHFETRILRRRMNWKLVVDTFLEGYHIQVLHKKTVAPLLDGSTIDFKAYGRNLRMTLPRWSITALRDQPEAEWDVLKHSAIIYVLFPNVVLIWQGDHVETWHVYPAGDGADESVMHVSLYTPEPASSEKAREHWAKNMDLLMRTVEDEDFPLGEDIQRGFHSGAQDHITFGRNEPCLAHYHRSIKEALQSA